MQTTRSSAVALTAVLLSAPAAAQSTREASMAGRSDVYAPRGAIATSHPLASAAGLDVLQRGGNAIDAAVTAAAVLTVVEPYMTGIGGDLFAMVWSARDGTLSGLNASGRAGSLMTRDALLQRGLDRIPLRGAAPVTVPGALSGWVALLERYGTLTLAQALAPAIRIAEEGFPVSPIISRDWAAETESLRADPGARATFLLDGERAPAEGEWFSNADFARTLREIAERGAAHFYGGELGERIAQHLQQNGGFLSAEDFASHRPQWVEPISVPFQGYRLWELPPNGQGIAALEMLRILEGFDLKSMGHNSTDYLHTLIEAKKLAYADVEHVVGDPASMTIEPERLLGDDYVRQRRALIDPLRAADRPEPGAAITASETIYLSVADAQGNMVSLINSIYWEFGSGVVVPGTGFALQNRGYGFTMEPGRANTVAPGKLPFHTIIPAFVTKTTRAEGVLRDASGEEPWLSFGVMGGAMQPQGHVQVLLNLLVFDMGLQQAIDAGRFRHLAGMNVALEPPIGEDVRRALRERGHEIADERSVAFGGAQAVMKLIRGWRAASDARKDGLAVGY